MTTPPSPDELRDYLAGRPAAELIADLTALYAEDNLVRDFYTLRLRPAYAQELLARARAQISAAFLPPSGGYDEAAQQALRSYRRLVAAPEGNAELMIYAVEVGAAFVADYGGVDGPLAAWLEDTFERALTLLHEHDRLALYQERSAQIVRAIADTGWGLGDSMQEIYASFFAPELGE